MRSSRFINDIKDNRVVTELLRHRRVYLFEYFSAADTMVVYDQALNVQRTIEHYVGSACAQGCVLPEDRWQLRELLTGQMHAPWSCGRSKRGSCSTWRRTPCLRRISGRGRCLWAMPRT